MADGPDPILCMTADSCHHPMFRFATAVLVALMALALLGFHFRRQLIERYVLWRNNRRWYHGFEADLENGLSSSNFDVSANIRAQDPRTLDENAKLAIKTLMEEQQLSFDDARLQYFHQRMAENGVDADGVPTDPRTVTLS